MLEALNRVAVAAVDGIAERLDKILVLPESYILFRLSGAVQYIFVRQ